MLKVERSRYSPLSLDRPLRTDRVPAKRRRAECGGTACHEHPLLADAPVSVLGEPWHVGGLDLRAPIPRSGEQGLHPDYGERRTEEPWQTLAAMWCVTPFTRDSGPLRVIPGSHRRAEPPIDTEHGYGTGMGPHPDEVKIIAPAGSVLLFNSADLWHSGTFNYTPAARLALTVHFSPGRQPSGVR
jgi:hypothetical protein